MCSLREVPLSFIIGISVDIFFFTRPVQPGVQEWKERISIRNMSLDVMDLSDVNLENGSTERPERHNHILASSLCYACHTTLTSRSSRGARKVAGIGAAVHNVPLPTWVSKNLCENSRIREQIQEFLIDTTVEDSTSNGNVELVS